MTAFGFSTASRILSQIALSQRFYWLQESGTKAHLPHKQEPKSSDYTWQRKPVILVRGDKWHIKYGGGGADFWGKKSSSKGKKKKQVDVKLKVVWRTAGERKNRGKEELRLEGLWAAEGGE